MTWPNLEFICSVKKEKEEHIYTFCPAVVFTGRQKKDEESESEEVLGAVGGSPVSLPPRHPPPIPSGHPSGLPKSTPEKAPSSPLKELTPPPLPSSLPPPLRRAQSPTSLTPPNEQAPPPPVGRPPPLVSPPFHGITPSPLFPQASEPPPLPPARHQTGSLSASNDPPPLPPARPHLEERLLDSASCRPEVMPPKQHKFHLAPHSQDNGDSDQESADYSSDFVSEAFWEINRRIPIPTARHSILPDKTQSLSLDSFTETEEERVEAEAFHQKEYPSSGQAGQKINGLDEGYSDLAMVKVMKKSKKDRQIKAESTLPNQQENVQICLHDRLLSEKVSSTNPEFREKSGSSSCEYGISNNFDDRLQDTVSSEDAFSESSAFETDLSLPQNFYSAFPVHEELSQDITMENGFDDSDEMTEKQILMEESLQKIESSGAQENQYDVAYGVSSGISSNDVPPLPPRHDSLIKRNTGNSSPGIGSDDDASPGITNSSSSSDEIEIEAFTHKQALIPSKSFQYVSSVPAGLNSHGIRNNIGDIPPILPPRKGSRFNRGMSVDTAELAPPPLPARKAGSVRGQRPLTAPPGCEENSSLLTEQNLPCKRPQQRIREESTTAENNLRHRMRLDRAHSVHSVISLKQSQAEILRQEMELSGVSVTVNLRAASHIALVDCCGLVCIAGWNQSDFPSLHGKFHIGDIVLSINSVKVANSAMAVKLLKHQTAEVVEVMVKRIPYGQVIAIRRSAEGESLGIRRVGGTAEIEYVDPHGLAASNGLPLRPSSFLTDKRTTWTLTEINSRHLNLFFKDLENGNDLSSEVRVSCAEIEEQLSGELGHLPESAFKENVCDVIDRWDGIPVSSLIDQPVNMWEIK
ncbi:hypothetical protein C0Q70_10042 [Pomacea canaliculata]|uniref:PDZ domain-containing protein n=1 Tax=Pomacea canaliculata TaxID=400727 RepID=A0A2T7PBH4_POMCA|nr:hypothetical protein C0Q70_10042 [Pomacea canaliculata]